MFSCPRPLLYMCVAFALFSLTDVLVHRQKGLEIMKHVLIMTYAKNASWQAAVNF